MVRVHWHVLLNVSSEKKAHLLLSRIEKQLGLPVAVNGCVQHREDATIYEASFTTHLWASLNVAQAVYDTLVLAGRLGPHWTVGPPQTYVDDGFSLDGGRHKRNGFVIPGLVSATFYLTNSPADPGEPSSR